MKRVLRQILFAAGMTLIAAHASFAAVIGFEELTDDTPVRDFYETSELVTFDLATAISAGLSLNELEFPPYGGSNVAYDNTGPVVIKFLSPMRFVSAFFTYAAPLELAAFDSNGVLLDLIVSKFSNNTLVSGDFGSSPNELLGFSYTSPVISSVTIMGDPGGFSFVFDDLAFSTTALSVPEPGTLILVFLTGAGILLVRVTRWAGGCIGATASTVLSKLAYTAFIAFAMLGSAASYAQLKPRPVPNSSSATMTLSLSGTTEAVTIESIDVDPSVIPNGIPTEVKVRAVISGVGVLPTGVAAQLVDNNGRIIRTLGILRDDGTAGDELSLDGTYTATILISEDTPSELRLQISVAVKGKLLRVASSPFYLSVRSDTTVFNKAKDLWAINLGTGGIAVYFGGPLPTNTKALRLLRSQHGSNTWEAVQDFDYDAENFILPLFDGIDGSLGMFDYKLQVLGLSGDVLKDFGSLTIPKFIDSSSAAETALPAMLSAPAASATIDPAVNSAFISDDVMEDSTAMNPQQILDLLTERGSFLKTKTIDDTYTDTDGVKFSPAQLIYDLAQKYRINPQVILVTMQKESLLVTSSSKPSEPADGWMGAKGCAKTFRAQLDCGVSRFRKFLDDIDSKGETIGGWAPNVENKTCAGSSCSWENLSVTPANRATAAFWQYTPVVGKNWGGYAGVGGQALNIEIWYPSLFKNLVNIIQWKDCGGCPTPPEVGPEDPLRRGKVIRFGAPLTPLESGFQSPSRHGFSGGLPPNPSYQVELDCNLNTWDSYNAPTAGGTGYWDVFLVNILQVKYWDSSPFDPISAPFTFGGAQYGDGLPSSLKKKVSFKVTTSAASPNFLNVLLDTGTTPSSDSAFPSWGQCTILKVLPSVRPGTNGLVDMPE